MKLNTPKILLTHGGGKCHSILGARNGVRIQIEGVAVNKIKVLTLLTVKSFKKRILDNRFNAVPTHMR